MLTRARSLGRHRGKTPYQLRAALDEATCELVALATEIADLKAERTKLEGELDTAAVDLSGMREDLNLAREEIRQLEEAVELRDRQIGDLERKDDIGVLAEAAATRTQEIPVITQVLPLHQSPLAVADPGRVPPSWARGEGDTASVPITDPEPAA